MLGYDKIFNSTKTHTDKPGLESSSSVERSSIENNEWGFIELVVGSYSMEEIALTTAGLSVGLEDESPFDGIGDFDGDDTSFETNDFDNSDGDTGSSDNDNIFDSSSDDPWGDSGNNQDNPFGDIGGDDQGNDQQSKQGKLVIDRKEILDRKFDMSRVVRKDFPNYIVKLQQVVTSAIDIIEKKAVHPDLNDSKISIVARYREVLKSIETYLTIIDSESYEDIFTTYVSFWSILNALKKSANKLL